MEQEILKPIDYVAALGWTLMGIALIKGIIYPKGVTFNLKKWFGENIQDAFIGVIACPVIMQLGASVLGLAKYYTGIDTSAIEEMLNKGHLSSVQLALVLSMVIQWKLYTRYKNKS